MHFIKLLWWIIITNLLGNIMYSSADTPINVQTRRCLRARSQRRKTIQEWKAQFANAPKYKLKNWDKLFKKFHNTGSMKRFLREKIGLNGVKFQTSLEQIYVPSKCEYFETKGQKRQYQLRPYQMRPYQMIPDQTRKPDKNRKPKNTWFFTHNYNSQPVP
ncbi:hypothetical protein B5X24_HaOG209629 [Helicoverpa armigera]|nr:hypothetical protein B5X24_HaOG209629 [Helicoverpa armigera]